MRKTKRDYIFTGCMERPFDPETDGWMNEMPDAGQFSIVGVANDVLDMFNEIKVLKKKNWELKRALLRAERAAGAYIGTKSVTEVVSCSNCQNFHKKGYQGNCIVPSNETFYNIEHAESVLGTFVLEVASNEA